MKLCLQGDNREVNISLVVFFKNTHSSWFASNPD